MRTTYQPSLRSEGQSGFQPSIRALLSDLYTIAPEFFHARDSDLESTHAWDSGVLLVCGDCGFSFGRRLPTTVSVTNGKAQRYGVWSFRTRNCT